VFFASDSRLYLKSIKEPNFIKLGCAWLYSRRFLCRMLLTILLKDRPLQESKHKRSKPQTVAHHDEFSGVLNQQESASLSQILPSKYPK
jgi:hypothetical protein